MPKDLLINCVLIYGKIILVDLYFLNFVMTQFKTLGLGFKRLIQ